MKNLNEESKAYGPKSSCAARLLDSVSAGRYSGIFWANPSRYKGGDSEPKGL